MELENPKSIQKLIADLTAEDDRAAEAIHKLQVHRQRIRKVLDSVTELMSPLAPDPPEFEGNLADACRTVLKRVAPKGLTPLEVRGALKGISYNLAKHQNPMASIHSVLKRLKDQGDVTASVDDGETRYAWVVEKPSVSPKSRTLGELGTAPLSTLGSLGAVETAILGNQTFESAMAYYQSLVDPTTVRLRSPQSRTK